MQVLYCSVCSMPPEYCEFGPSLDQCKSVLKRANPDLFQKVYPSDAVVENAEAAAVQGGAEDGAVPDIADLSINDTPKPAKNKKQQPPKVTIKREARNKRKSTVTVSGLHHYDVDLKKAAKMFAQKFACGSSVSKNPQGFDDIVVQGDVEYEIEELILQSFKQIPSEMIQNISK